MKFNCEQSDLSRFLQVAVRAISTKSTLPILTGILVETRDQVLRCVATDLEISVELNIPGIQIIEPGSVVIPGKTFVDIIRHLPMGMITVEKEASSNMITISAKHASFQLPLLPLEEFPSLPEADQMNQFQLKGTVLKEAIKQTIYATLSDDPRPFLSSILWEIKPDTLKLVATDINRLAIKEMPIEGGIEATALVPVRAFREIANIFGNNSEDEVTVRLSDRVIFISGSGITFSSRLIEAQFPRYEQVIPKEFNGSLVVKRTEFIDSLERSALVSSSVKLKIFGEQIEITAKEPDKGHLYEDLPAQIDGKELEIGFNIRFLLDFLKATDTENIVFKYIQEQKPGVLQGEGRTDYQYIVMPLKLSAG